MEFLTNHLQWSAASVADLYRCRWQIEVFFKQIKQSLQLCDFLGNSANAIRWQVWTALLLYVLMRFLCVLSRWNHSFTRLFTLLRAALWRKIDLWDLLRFCGTAGGHFRYLGDSTGCLFSRIRLLILWDSIATSTKKFFIGGAQKVLNRFRRKTSARPLQFSISRAVLAVTDEQIPILIAKFVSLVTIISVLIG